MAGGLAKAVDWDHAVYFRRGEFCCRCGCGANLTDRELLRGLDALRELAGRPIVVHSGTRCAAHNRAVGGEPGSQHLLGRAADISAAGLTPRQLARLALDVEVFREGGIGVYGWGVHVDVRGRVSRWKERGGALVGWRSETDI